MNFVFYMVCSDFSPNEWYRNTNYYCGYFNDGGIPIKLTIELKSKREFYSL